jgi:multicomponent Na+:H+ antiporter subunit D
MVAPAPVSALLHAVAVVKAGAFGIVRVVYDVYGVEFAASSACWPVLARWPPSPSSTARCARCSRTGSSAARLLHRQPGVLHRPRRRHRRAGGDRRRLVHLVHQGIMKITLFFCAGNYAETLGVHKVSQMDGVGRRMPWTTLAFTIGALGMIGIPPIAGFVSKWYLGLGAVEAGAALGAAGAGRQHLLNAGYFLPILYRAWFLPSRGDWPAERRYPRAETSLALLAPPVITGLLALGVGLFAAIPFSPQEWAQLVARREFYAP